MSRQALVKRPVSQAICLAVITVITGTAVCCLLVYAGGMWGAKAVADTPAPDAGGNSAQGSTNDVPVPTAQFIAAALRNQASASIKVKYSLSDSLTYEYIRTPEALAMTETFLKSGDVTRASYDFAARENRQLETRRDGTAIGRVGTWLADPFVNQDLLDPVLFVLPWGMEGPRPLYEWVPLGRVLPQQESVDGHPCWRLDLTAPAPVMQSYSIWVDPQVGFCPRQIEFVFTDSRRGPTVIKFQDYRELASGIWFPMKQVAEFPARRVSSSSAGKTVFTLVPATPTPSAEMVTDEGRTQSTRTATEATAGNTFSKDSLLVKFPSGTKVYVGGSSTPVTAP